VENKSYVNVMQTIERAKKDRKYFGDTRYILHSPNNQIIKNNRMVAQQTTAQQQQRATENKHAK
jgi:hypothetical protein